MIWKPMNSQWLKVFRSTRYRSDQTWGSDAKLILNTANMDIWDLANTSNHYRNVFRLKSCFPVSIRYPRKQTAQPFLLKMNQLHHYTQNILEAIISYFSGFEWRQSEIDIYWKNLQSSAFARKGLIGTQRMSQHHWVPLRNGKEHIRHDAYRK